MSTNRLPYGAAEILDLRMTGKRPAEMVLVSLIGPLRETNPVIVAKPGGAYDWRCLADLDVLVVARSDTDAAAVHGMLQAIKALPARSLSLWFADRQDGRHLIIDGVQASRRGLLQYMGAEDRRRYAGLGLKQEGGAACM